MVFTLREEFLGRLAQAQGVQEVLEHITVLRSPSPEALEETLERPLEMLGHGLDDPRLAREMVAEVAGELSCLPLLQFACQALWERRDRHRRMLLRAVYEKMGGVAGALAWHADGVMTALSPDERPLARSILLRLVTPQGTRQMLPCAQVLEGLGPRAGAVLGLLTEARLIVVKRSREGEDAELELTHESLISSWTTLARWIEEGREDLAFLAELEQATELWERKGRREEELWHGLALQEASRALGRCSAEVPARARRFIEAGERRHRRRLRRRRLGLASGIMVLAVIALTAVLVAWRFSQKEREIKKQRDRSESRHAAALREGARAAYARGDLLEARARLRLSLQAQDATDARLLWWKLQRRPLLWKKTLSAPVWGVDMSRDVRLLAAACSDRMVYLMDARTGRVLRVLRGHGDRVLGVSFSPDSRYLAACGSDRTIRIWDIKTHRHLATLKGHTKAVRGIRFSPDGKTLASASFDYFIKPPALLV